MTTALALTPTATKRPCRAYGLRDRQHVFSAGLQPNYQTRWSARDALRPSVTVVFVRSEREASETHALWIDPQHPLIRDTHPMQLTVAPNDNRTLVATFLLTDADANRLRADDRFGGSLDIRVTRDTR